MTFTIPALLEWVHLGEQLIASGQGAYNAVKDAAAAHGVLADTAQLDAVILDAERRKALAEAEAGDRPD